MYHCSVHDDCAKDLVSFLFWCSKEKWEIKNCQVVVDLYKVCHTLTMRQRTDSSTTVLLLRVPAAGDVVALNERG